MGALGNPQHERFCQSAHKRMWEGMKRGDALAEAYLDEIYTGSKGDRGLAIDLVRDNARRLANTKSIKARITELFDHTAELNGIDPFWAMRQLKRRVEDFNLDDYLTERVEGAPRFIDIARADRAKLGKLAELSVEEDIIEAGEETMRRVRKTKIKPYDPAPIITLMAKIGGWMSPEKTAFTDPKGDGPAEMTVRWKDADADVAA